MCEILLYIYGIFSHRFKRSDILGKSPDLATFSLAWNFARFLFDSSYGRRPKSAVKLIKCPVYRPFNRTRKYQGPLSFL